MAIRRKLGEIFVEQGIITEKTVARILNRSSLLNQRFGTVLEDLELITGEELASALAIQYGFRTVSNLLSYSYPPELFRIIPVEVCIEHVLFPLRREQNKLALAMSDPTDIKVVRIIAENNGLAITPYIATRTEIFRAINRYYFGSVQVSADINTVLVVDDDPLITATTSAVLTKHGYRVISAADGMDAFKSVIAEKPQVIITDMVMPKLDGFGLLRALQNVPEMVFTPVILISAVDDDEIESRAFEKGFFDFIRKPLPETSLLVRLKRAFVFKKHHYRFIQDPAPGGVLPQHP